MIEVELIGSNTARHDGVSITKSAKDPVPPLCRKLLAMGHGPNEDVHVHRKGMSVYSRNRTIGQWASLEIVDTDRGIIQRPYRPYAGPGTDLEDAPELAPVAS